MTSTQCARCSATKQSECIETRPGIHVNTRMCQMRWAPELPSIAAAREPTALTVELTGDGARQAQAYAVDGCYWSGERKRWCTDNPTPRTAAAIMAIFPELLEQYPQLAEIRESEYGEARPHDYAGELQISTDLGPFGDGKELYDWQDIDAGYLSAIMKRDGGAFVGWAPGLGKTLCTAAFIRKFGWQRTIVVCRNDVKEAVWKRELNDVIPEAEVVVIPNEKKKREKLLDVIAHIDEHDPNQPLYQDGTGPPMVFVIHYEAIAVVADRVPERDKQGKVRRGHGKGWARLGKWDALVYDEGHRLANMNPNAPRKNSQMGKALMRLRKKHVRHAVNLTGSGIMNHAEDLFGQLHFLYPDRYKAKWADWNDRYLDFIDVGPRKVCIGFRPDRLDDLRRELGVFMVYRTKREVFPDLGEPLIQNVELDLHPAQRKAYEEVRDQFWTRIEEEGVKAVNPLAQMNMLRRLATYYPGLQSAKLDYALAELDELSDEQFVVFTWYKEPGRALMERFGDDVVVVDGDVKQSERTWALEQHEKGHARVLVGSIATIGESLNLQYCHEAIRLDRDWNPQKNKQTIDRLHRNGQQQLVTLRDLWAKDTVDTLRVRPSLVGKESLRKAIFG